MKSPLPFSNLCTCSCGEGICPRDSASAAHGRVDCGEELRHIMRSTGVIFGVLLLSATAAAQQYVISTYAGGAPPPTPVRGVDAPFGAALGVAADAAGNVYFPSLNCVFKLDGNGVLTRVAGNSRAGYSGDGGPATSAQLGARWGVAVD